MVTKGVTCWVSVLLASQNNNPIKVYSVAIYRTQLSHVWANVISLSTEVSNASVLLVEFFLTYWHTLITSVLQRADLENSENIAFIYKTEAFVKHFWRKIDD